MTNYFSFQHFRKMNVRFMLLKKIPLCMKLSVIMLFICVGLAYASDSYSQNVLLNIDVNNKSVQEVLDEIEKQSDFHFFYNNKQVNTSRIVSIKVLFSPPKRYQLPNRKAERSPELSPMEKANLFPAPMSFKKGQRTEQFPISMENSVQKYQIMRHWSFPLSDT